MSDDVAILVPVLGRPHRVAPLLRSIRAATPGRWRVVFVCDPGDAPQRYAVQTAAAALPDNVEEMVFAGNYAAKINAAARTTVDPLLFLGADDLHFHAGWLSRAVKRLTAAIGVVGTNDLGNQRVVAGDHATHSLVARWYADLGTIDEPGKVLHEGYRHCFCDDELVGTAKHRRAWAFAADAIVEHLHPDWGKAQRDSTYDQGQATFRFDRRVHRGRRHLWT